MLDEFMHNHRLDGGFRETAQSWYRPLAEQIRMHHNGAKQPLFLGINGCQGSGKSTLTAFLQEYLKHYHQLNTVVLSLDDFYLSQAARVQLANSVHPLLRTRGVPGTHLTATIHHVLNQLAAQQPVRLPRFSKAADNPLPDADCPTLSPLYDVVIFEGWCWGIEAQSESQLAEAVNPLEQQEDPDGYWRHYVNQQLKEHYMPLYAKMHLWLMLKAPSFDVVFQWRRQQEQKLRDKVGMAAGVMNDQQIQRFIQHYQRLTEHALHCLPSKVDLLLELDAGRQIVSARGIH